MTGPQSPDFAEAEVGNEGGGRSGFRTRSYDVMARTNSQRIERQPRLRLQHPRPPGIACLYYLEYSCSSVRLSTKFRKVKKGRAGRGGGGVAFPYIYLPVQPHPETETAGATEPLSLKKLIDGRVL